MTTALNLISNNEYVLGILQPFARIISLEWTLFLLFTLIMVMLYLKTETLSIPLMVGIVLVGSTNLSHLFQTDLYPLIPDPLSKWASLMARGALA